MLTAMKINDNNKGGRREIKVQKSLIVSVGEIALKLMHFLWVITGKCVKASAVKTILGAFTQGSADRCVPKHFRVETTHPALIQ